MLPPLNTWLIYRYGWQFGWRFWAVLLLVVMAPLSRLLVRNKPEDVGLLPDNQQVTAEAEKTQNEALEASSWTLSQAKSTRSFWLLLFCMFDPSMVNTGLTFHVVSILGVQGLSPQIRATVLSIMAVVAMPFTFISGYLLDRFPVRWVMAFTFVGQVVIMVLLLFAKSVELAILYGVLRGIVQGFEGMNFNVMWPDYFGRKHLGTIRGYAMIFTVVGSAFGPLPFGLAYDFFGGYTEIIVLMTLFPLVAVFASAFALKPSKELNVVKAGTLQ